MVFSLNGAVAELSRDESAGQAHLIVDTIGTVIRGGGDGADGGLWPERRRIGWINHCKPLIDGLLMKQAVSQKQKQLVHSVEPESAPAPGLSALNRCAGWNLSLIHI